jgi:hypothetical protein
MFAMLFTLFVAVLAATMWALRSFFFETGSPHDPSTLELALMGIVTLATYRWMKRLQWLRERTAPVVDVAELLPPTPVPVRYAEARAEIELEKSLQSAEHVA